MYSLKLPLILLLLFSCSGPKGDIYDAEDITMSLKSTNKPPFKINNPVTLTLSIKFEEIDPDESYCWAIHQQDGEGTINQSEGELIQDNKTYIKKLKYTPKTPGNHTLKLILRDNASIVKVCTLELEIIDLPFYIHNTVDSTEDIEHFTLHLKIQGEDADYQSSKTYRLTKVVMEGCEGILSQKGVPFISGAPMSLTYGANTLEFNNIKYNLFPGVSPRLILTISNEEGSTVESIFTLEHEFLGIDYSISCIYSEGALLINITERNEKLMDKTWSIESYSFSDGILGTIQVPDSTKLTYGLNTLELCITDISSEVNPQNSNVILSIKGPDDKLQEVQGDITEECILASTLDPYMKELLRFETDLLLLYREAKNIQRSTELDKDVKKRKFMDIEAKYIEISSEFTNVSTDIHKIKETSCNLDKYFVKLDRLESEIESISRSLNKRLQSGPNKTTRYRDISSLDEFFF